MDGGRHCRRLRCHDPHFRRAGLVWRLRCTGNAVPFVLWFNFLSGFAYVLAGIGIALSKPWGGTLATALALGILVVFALLGWHVLRGGAYEMRTVGAMALRAAVWIGIAIFLGRSAMKN
jgi:hypothetical protein